MKTLGEVIWDEKNNDPSLPPDASVDPNAITIECIIMCCVVVCNMPDPTPCAFGAQCL